MKYTKKEQTKRFITIEFENDQEYICFVKSLSKIENLLTFPVTQEIFEQEYTEVSEKEDLLDNYNNYSYPF